MGSRIVQAVQKLQILERGQCFDPINTASRPTKKQREVLDDFGVIQHRYVVAGNQSGKSQLGAREVAWVLCENHPKWTRPAEWGDESLVILVIGRVGKQVEDVLWRKIESFLEAGTYRKVVTGNSLQKVVHKNGNTIIFASHHADNEAREKLQAYVAHYVWVDEMPKSVDLIEELHRRVQSRGGYFLATFTPKVRNEDIRKLVDNARPPHAKKYALYMLDNPTLTKKKKEAILHSMETYPKAKRDTLLYGAWSLGDDSVYDFRGDDHCKDPPNYSPGWRHVEVVDPAIKSKMGYTLWAEDPYSGIWYCVRAEYIEGVFDPGDLVETARKKSQGHSIIRRVSDPHEAWYIGAASKVGISYMGVYNKNSRKGELIKNLQSALGSKIFIASWCKDLIEEFVECQWAEADADRIINASRFHLLDCAQYFVDTAPVHVREKPPESHDQWMRDANRKRKEQEAAKKKLQSQKISRSGNWRGRRVWKQSLG